MPITEELAAVEVSNAITLERVKISLVQDVMKILDRVENDLVAELSTIDPTAPARSLYKQQRLEAALRSARELSAELYSQAGAIHTTSLVGVATLNQKAFKKSIEKLLGVDIVAGEVSAGTLLKIAEGTLTTGATTAEWFSRQSNKLIQDYSDTLAQGMARGESLGELVRRVRGSRDLGYADGVMGVARNNAASLVKTSTQAVLQEARFQLYAENSDVIKGVQWLSTLDRRTSSVCKVLSGCSWDLEGNPINHSRGTLRRPPAHWGCRSTLLSLLRSWDELSKNKQLRLPGVSGTGNFEEKFREKLAARGFKPEKIEAAVLRAKEKLNGSTNPQNLNYSTWLKAQPEKLQREALGAKRFKLYQAGKIEVNDLINGQLSPLTVSQLENISQQ